LPCFPSFAYNFPQTITIVMTQIHVMSIKGSNSNAAMKQKDFWSTGAVMANTSKVLASLKESNINKFNKMCYFLTKSEVNKRRKQVKINNFCDTLEIK